MALLEISFFTGTNTADFIHYNPVAVVSGGDFLDPVIPEPVPALTEGQDFPSGTAGIEE